MGADMLGFFLTYPSNAAATKAVRKHVAAVMKDLSAVADLEALRTGEYNAGSISKEKVDAFLEKHTGWQDEVENCELEPGDAVDLIMKDLDLVAEFDPKHGFDYRDVAQTGMKVNGVEVVTLFAGGMSWGDEPDGGGYQALKAMWRSGTGDVLWKLALDNAKSKR